VATAASATKKTTGKAAPRPRRRSPKRTVQAVDVDAARRDSTRRVEQLVLIALAILLGFIGLAVHVIWFGSIVLMSVLFGLIASGLRGQRGGVMAEMATTVMVEAKSVADGISNSGAKEHDPTESP
jgi:hypothetical protein